MLKRIHSSHIGVRCLQRARACLYWPRTSAEVKEHISTCETCRTYETKQPKETLMIHEVPQGPCRKVGSDLFTLNNCDYLVTVDYYSDYYELDKLPNAKAGNVIKATKSHFARHGIPEQLISDNGPQYISDEFKLFAREQDFEHKPVDPYNSQANGKVESAVKKAKKILRKSKKSNSDAFLALLDQRNTSTQDIGSSPVQRLMNRRTRTILPTAASLLQPRSINPEQERGKMKEELAKQPEYYNRNAHEALEEGDVVRMQPFKLGQKEWKKGTIKRRLGEKSYEVETPDAVYRRNRVHLKKTFEASDTTDIDLSLPTQEVSPQPQVIHAEPSTTQPPPQPVPKTPASTTVKSSPKTRIPVPVRSPVRTRSGCTVKPLSYLTTRLRTVNCLIW